MTPRVSETVGCRMIGEFIDEPGSNPPDVGGKPSAASEGVGVRMVGEFVDQSRSIEPPTQEASRLPLDLEASAAATALYDRAVTLYEQLVREGRSDLASELARAYANKAVAVRELGEQRAAAALADQTIALYERLVEQEGRHELANDLATAYDNKAVALNQSGDPWRTVVLYDRAIAIRERLVQHEGRQELADDLARTHQNRDLALASTVLRTGSTLPVVERPLVIDATTDPFAVIRRLLVQANRGDESLATLRGCEFVRELGRGGMGAVALIQRSSSLQTAERLALKVMLPQVAAIPKGKERFEREIEISRALAHPHIVPLRHWGCWQEIYFFTSEYCDGGDVEQLSKQHGGKLSPEQALPIIFQTLDALDYAHHARVRVKLASGKFDEADGVVHRDVKPSNIFLCGSGACGITKLGDFGLAKAFATAGLSGLTRQGAIGGSIQYMPQQLLDDFQLATPEVDVWSAAASLYYLLTGHPPRDFSNEPTKRWLWVVSNKPAVPIRQREATIPPALAEVIDHALDDRDSLQFSSAAALKRALESVL